MSQSKLSRNFFVAVLIGTTCLFFYMVRSFLVPVLLATVFSTLLYPFFQRLVRLFRGRRVVAALLCCFLFLLVLVLPLYGVGELVVQEAVSFYNDAGKRVLEVMEKGNTGYLGKLTELRWVKALRLDQINWKSYAANAGATAGKVAGALFTAASRGTVQVVVILFTTLFTMFYFFRDGEKLAARIKYLIPMEAKNEEAIVARFIAVSRATLKGTLLIALIQGALTGLALWIFGVDSAILWGVVAVLASIVPMVGAWMVLYPAAIIQLISGHVWQGVGIILVTSLFISHVDNLLRPRLVGQEAGMHDLMVFFSTLGGIGLFGAVGFIVGPIIAALFLSVLDIYSTKFAAELRDGPTLLLPGGLSQEPSAQNASPASTRSPAG
jgi:predicted PurR-regulated permease PerM